MNARLLIVDPETAPSSPLIPNLVVDNEGKIVLCGDYWALPVNSADLSQVTLEEVRAAMRLRPNYCPSLFLSPMRELPSEDLMSPEALAWSRQWWLDYVSELVRAGKVTDAPALKATV